MADEWHRPETVQLLSGGNPQIPKGDGEAPVRAYLEAMPGWKAAVGRRLDALIAREAPLTPERVIHLARQILEVLDEAQRRLPRPEGRDLDHHPGDEPVQVLPRRRGREGPLDRAAEHERAQLHDRRLRHGLYRLQ